MRVLITGISGFAGSHLAEYLLHLGGIQLSGVLWGRQNNAAHLMERFQSFWVDLTDEQATRDVLHTTAPEAIVHLAAQAFPSASWEDPWATLAVNIRAQVNVLHAVTQLGLHPRIVVVSSAEVYGRVRPEDLPLTEETPMRPDSPYGVSKVTQDFLGLQYFISHRLPIVRMRPFNHIGRRQDSRFVAANFARQIAEIELGQREPVIRVGNLESQRDFSDVRDIVRGYWLALTQGTPGEAYNLGSGCARSIRDLLDGLLRWTTADCRVEVDESRFRVSDTPISYGDYGKLQRETGWTPVVPFEDTLREVLEDARERVRAGAL